MIHPKILRRQKVFFNKSWMGDVENNSILLDKQVIPDVLEWLRHNYRYPYITTHEVLFTKNISMRYVVAIVCSRELKPHVRKYLREYGYHLPIDDHFLKRVI